MTRRTLLWALGAVSVVLGAVLLAIDEPMWDAGGSGIVGFQLAGSEERAREILVEWGDDGRDAARLSLWLDFPYLIVYGAFWTLAVAAVRDIARRLGWRRFAGAGSVLIASPAAAAGLDAVEDVALLLVLGEEGGSVVPPLAAAAAGLKFLLIGVAIAYVAISLTYSASANPIGPSPTFATRSRCTSVWPTRTSPSRRCSGSTTTRWRRP